MCKKIVLALLCLTLLAPTSALAGAGENALTSVALYVDTTGHYLPGSELLTKGLNEVLRYKLNMFFLGSEVLSGNEVLRGLSRSGISSGVDADAANLSSYAAAAHVNNVILLTVCPLDMEMNVKAYNLATDSFLVNRTVAAPDASSLSKLDVFSDLIGQQLAEISAILKS